MSLEGANNLRDQKTGTFGLLVSRKLARVAAVYAEPMFLVNSNHLDTGDSNTAMIGLGGRISIRPSTYVVAEVTPRLAGYRPGVAQGSFGLEMRAGGHTFQINFSNGLGTTPGQIARDGVSGDSWFIGFNISRKFF